MVQMAEATLSERAGYLYRRLLLLQRVFAAPDPDADGPDDKTQDAALRAGIGEMLEELAEHARILTTVPYPLCDWRVGDGPDDERWRAFTEIERRALLSMVGGYEELIAWAERASGDAPRGNGPLKAGGSDLGRRAPAPVDAHQNGYLQAERERLSRFREEMSFLDRRRPMSPRSLA